jgi:hypothetical protein
VLASSREEAGRRALDKLGKVRSAVVDITPEEVVI